MHSSAFEFGHIHCCKQGINQEHKTKWQRILILMGSSRYDLPHLDLHCLNKYLFGSARMKELIKIFKSIKYRKYMYLHSLSDLLEESQYTLRETSLSKLFCLTSDKGSTLQRKNFL